MSQVCTLSLVLFSFRIIYAYPGENVLLPSYEMRNMDTYRSPAFQQYSSQFQRNRYANRPQQVLHNDVIQKQPVGASLQVPMVEKPSDQNVTYGDLMAALNEVSQQGEDESQLLRAAASGGRDESPTYSSRPIGYSGSSYVAPASDTETPAVLTPPSTTQSKISLLKPDFSSFLKPVATKAPGKLDGLLGLVFSLLTSSSGGMHGSGLKGILIEGIIKPLLTANGGIKALISKLSIPVICLLLINIEVLVVAWWMWDECPAAPTTLPYEHPYPSSTASPPPYSKPAYNYNSYS